MGNTELSLRKRRTTRIIRESFIQLLKEKNIDDISINDLSEAADINRTTFYRYYSDIYALMDDISDKLFELIFSNIAKTNSQNVNEVPYNMILNAITEIEKNKELCKILICYHKDSKFEKKLVESFMDLSYQIHAPQYHYCGDANLQFNYIINGMIGLLRTWLENDCALPKKNVAHLVDKNVTSAYILLMEYL